MAKGKKGKEKKPTGPSIDVVAENRKARHKFEVLDTLEVGVALTGSEVKSLRERHISLDEAYARVRDGEVWLVNCDIPEYKQASLFNHAPKRPRKLLMHRSEIRKFANKAHENGLTLAPLRVYFNERGIVKVLLGLCKGKKLHDKRESLKKADSKREMARALRRRT
jgi:SsrA-binding protein